MLEKIAMWGGVAGIVVALFAIIIIFLTRKNILDILDKDVILFDRNFDIKKKAIEHSFRLLDRIEQNQAVVKDPAFKQEAKDCYNELLCVVSDLKVAFAFYSLAIKGNNIMPNTKYKLLARYDIGLNNKHSTKIKKSSKEDYPSYLKVEPKFEPRIEPKAEPKEEPKVAEEKPVEEAPKQVELPKVTPTETKPVTSVQPSIRPTAPAQPTPVTPAKPVAPIRPVAPVKPATQVKPATTSAVKPASTKATTTKTRTTKK